MFYKYASVLLLFIIIIFTEQSFRPPKARRLVLVTMPSMHTTMVTQPLSVLLLFIIVIFSPSFAKQSFRPAKGARCLVLVTMSTTLAAQPQPDAQPIQDDHHHPNNAENHRTSTTSSYDILSVIRLGFMIVLLLILILSALLKLISLLKRRDASPLPNHHAAAADQPSQNLFDVMQLQQAPLAPPHPHNVLSLSFTEQISMDADVDHVEIDDV